MHVSDFDWREEPRRVSFYSLSLLLIFAGAVAFILYAAAVLKPWQDDEPITYTDARTYADRGLTPEPPSPVPQP